MEAHHLCTQMRGVREVQPITRTTAFIGAYEGNSSLRSEFYDLAGLQRGVRE
jgi:GTP cyclohydrolase I